MTGDLSVVRTDVPSEMNVTSACPRDGGRVKVTCHVPTMAGTDFAAIEAAGRSSALAPSGKEVLAKAQAVITPRMHIVRFTIVPSVGLVRGDKLERARRCA
jgi:hypothetical protein